MRRRILRAAACTAAFAAPLLAFTPSAAAPGAAPTADPDPVKKCVVQPPPDAKYLCGNENLGPAKLPKEEPVASLVKTYDPLGPNLQDEPFLKEYSTTKNNKFRWIYPPAEGFLLYDWQHDPFPLRKPVELKPNTLVDRFGPPTGRFLSPAGVSFASRSLPPDALNTPTGGPVNNYYCYKVTKAFTVDYGPTAPAFEQPGGSVQYHLAYDPADPTKLAKTRVAQLTEKNEYLEPQPAMACKKS